MINKKNNDKIIFGICIILVVSLILFSYIKVTLEDKYFPYWDSYTIKTFSNDIESSPFKIFSDPLFFYNTNIFNKITGIDFYHIIRYSNLFFIILLFSVLFMLFNDSLEKKDKTGKLFILLSLIYFFSCFYSYSRFSITMRENLVLSLGLIVIFLLKKFDEKEKPNYIDIIPLSILYAYVLFASVQVFLIISGVVFFYTIYCFVKKRNRLKTLSFILLTAIIALPSVIQLCKGIIYQLKYNSPIVKASGFSASYNLVNLTHFNPPFDALLLIGLLWFFVDLKKEGNFEKYKFYIFFTASVLIGFLIAYIPSLTVKQNRFLIYIYIILALSFLFLLIKVKEKKLGKFIILLMIAMLLITTIPRNLEYKIYRPLNEKDISYVSSQISTFDKYDELYCGSSAKTILDYLDYNKCIPFEDNAGKISNSSILKGPIVLSGEDYELYEKRREDIFEKFNKIKDKNDYIPNKEMYTYIVMPAENKTLIDAA